MGRSERRPRRSSAASVAFVARNRRAARWLYRVGVGRQLYRVGAGRWLDRARNGCLLGRTAVGRRLSAASSERRVLACRPPRVFEHTVGRSLAACWGGVALVADACGFWVARAQAASSVARRRCVQAISMRGSGMSWGSAGTRSTCCSAKARPLTKGCRLPRPCDSLMTCANTAS